MQDSSSRSVEDDKMFDLCVHVLSLDRAILFCGLAHKSGYLMALASSSKTNRPRVAKNNGFKDGPAHAKAARLADGRGPADQSSTFLGEVELEKYIFQSGIIWGIHKLWERKLGHIQHIVSYYDEMPLVTIFLDGNHFLLMAIDSKSRYPNIDRIVSQKIIPSLERLSMLIRQDQDPQIKNQERRNSSR